jgi:hypothetical protein
MIPAILFAALLALIAVDYSQWRTFGMYHHGVHSRDKGSTNHVATICPREHSPSSSSGAIWYRDMKIF